MKPIRLSYSVLEPMSRGDIDETLRRYWKEPTPPTQAMIEGRKLHQQFQDETERTSKLPEVLGGSETLLAPQCELKLEVMLEEWLQFVGVIDLYAEKTIFEYKTGKAQLSYYASSYQPLVYQVLLYESQLKVNQAIFIKYNQHTEEVNKGKRYLNKNTYNLGREWIITYASELYNALQKTGEL